MLPVSFRTRTDTTGQSLATYNLTSMLKGEDKGGGAAIDATCARSKAGELKHVVDKIRSSVGKSKPGDTKTIMIMPIIYNG